MMRKNLIAFIFLLSLSPIFSQQTNNEEMTRFFPEPGIDKRTELLSIVFRLAGNQEYSSEQFAFYAKSIHDHFDKFRDHPVVAFAKKMRNEKGVSYDAVMKIAFHISQPPALTPLVEFSASVPEGRWGLENANKFLELLRDFYTTSGFEAFYDENRELYKTAEERFLTVYKALHIEWYNEYYGIKPEGSFNVIICLGNGGNNYGGKMVFPDKKEDAFAIMGTWHIDSLNNPFYKTEDYLPTLIHEFNHSYVNPLVDKFDPQLENAGKTIFDPIQNNLRRQAYGNWKTMFCESIVRASVIRYLLKYDSYEAARKQLIAETGNGFYWMTGLVNILSEYENSRNKYPTLESFMPLISEYFNNIAEDKDKMFEIKR